MPTPCTRLLMESLKPKILHTCAQVNQCSPAPFAAVIFFCTYMLVVVYLLLQLIIGIILENIEVGCVTRERSGQGSL